jgi:serine/threonine-protein kinase
MADSKIAAPTKALTAFICYSHEDAAELRELEKHLSLLKRQGLIQTWTDRQLNPGEDWRERLDEKLNSADVILLLISAAFFQSDYCYTIEASRALERHRVGEARVVPILVKPCDWLSDPIAKLQALPRDGRAVTQWPNPDAAWLEVAKGLRAMLERGLAAAGPVVSAVGRIKPRYRSREAEELFRELKVLYASRKSSILANRPTTDLDQQILQLKRQLRVGPQMQPGELLCEGRYELLEVVGHGGFATVWKCWDGEGQSLVALKMLHGQHSEDLSKRERFFRGARKMSDLAHPGIVGVIEAHGSDGGWHFYVMEFLAGGNLEECILEGRITQEQGLAAVFAVAEALAHAHGKGTVHRDVKPSNILLAADGRAKLSDFDLVRAEDTTGLTRTQTAMGTILFAAPEALLSGGQATLKADLYSLAAVATFVLRGDRLPPTFYRDPLAVVAKLVFPLKLQLCL